MTSRLDQIAMLPNGHRVAFNEYGDLNGRPVIMLHAAFFGRTFGEPAEWPAAEQGIRIVTPDRPGVGRSDFYSWTFKDYPAEIAAFADTLGIERFAVIGVSGGGAHALACAWQIPGRLDAVAVVSSMAPAVPAILRGLPWAHPLMSPSRRLPWLWRPQMAALARVMRHRPHLAVRMMARGLSETDRNVLASPAVRDYFHRGMREAVRQGGRGWALESRRTGSERWDTWLPEVPMAVHLWQGLDDQLTPPSMGRFLAQAIPQCRATFVPGAGHLWGIDHIDEVLDAILTPEEGTGHTDNRRV